MPPSVLWFRRDLRLDDNAALLAAVAGGGPVVPVYAWDASARLEWEPGGAQRWWLHHSLLALHEELRRRGSRLVLRNGDAAEILVALAAETGARTIHAGRLYDPDERALEQRVAQAAARRGVALVLHPGALLFDPADIQTRTGAPYRQFSAFWRACRAVPVPDPAGAAPAALSAPGSWPAGVPAAELGLLPRVDWAAEIRAAWRPGERAAQAALEGFLQDGLVDYADDRDLPGTAGTSRLSPHLHFGEISPRAVWRGVRTRVDEITWLSNPEGLDPRRLAASADVFLSQLGWREFAHHLLLHFPHTVAAPLRPEFAAFPWEADPEALHAWQRGLTGYPLVDAGMRQLWRTGWMHNRVRMVVASFLVKHLLIAWQDGAAWFWDTLVDADLANNTLGWQWTAGSGADAAPYFRVFNPVRQGERFDTAGEYVRRWLPELAGLPDRWIHQPWAAPRDVLSSAGVRLGEDYPNPIVDHDTARKRALAAFAHMRAVSALGRDDGFEGTGRPGRGGPGER